MALDILTSPADARLTPVPPRHAAAFCFALLVTACALASFAFACATPFAAFAVVAAALLPLRPALLCVLGAFLVNQGIGFGALHYPIDANTLAWAVAVRQGTRPRSDSEQTVWPGALRRHHRHD